jgi:hypothetical protein
MSTGLSLHDRRDAYLQAFPQCPDAVWVAGRGRWLYGCWQIGNDYRNGSRYYGAYPRSFLRRVMALFPDVQDENRSKPSILHAFSGSLPKGDYVRLDVKDGADVVGSVYDAPKLFSHERRFRLVLADPPYSAADSAKYGTGAIDRGRAMRALAQVMEPGGHLVWLDTVWPMHRKAEWHYYGQIVLVRSTNHRVRSVSLFERKL